MNYGNTCPQIIRDAGAIFVSFLPQIIALALKNYKMKKKGDRHYKKEVYGQLGQSVNNRINAH